MVVLAAAERPSATAYAPLGELLRGERTLPVTGSECTVYAAVSMPWQDLAPAWFACEEAARRGIGTTIDLLA